MNDVKSKVSDMWKRETLIVLEWVGKNYNGERNLPPKLTTKL
jgi:hypothetical protein